MTEKPVIRSQAATSDVQNAARYYRTTLSAQRAQEFIDALEEAYLHISRLPGSGSPRYSHIIDVANLRAWPVSGYPRPTPSSRPRAGTRSVSRPHLRAGTSSQRSPGRLT